MKGSLDTNVIIHFYRARLQHILFSFFDEGVIIYQQIRNIELENHGKDILPQIDKDIESGKIDLYTDQKLKDLAVYKLFEFNVKENRNLYGAGDLGEVYAISLAQTLGVYALVTDDIKQGGPYMSQLQFEDEVMPFTFADILILRYLFEQADESQTIKDFRTINEASNLNWSFQSHFKKFIRRFLQGYYRKKDKEWLSEMASKKEIKVKSKIVTLRNAMTEEYR